MTRPGCARGGGAGGKRESAGLLGRGEEGTGPREREAGRAGPRGKKQGEGWAACGFGLVFFFPFSFSFLFPLNSKLFEFKFKFEFKP